ncbi:hypothetical protein Pmani_001946 [Petrolisthes manimaculis]|uniref:RNA helicase n=1 Tax=Petrolisthes manimaculis TaxID=1843537 RepID=A0AAE1URH5_9EUCA|nr:hypothetical protein Pmani_001946 [Petrolisthes manimaculis]
MGRNSKNKGQAPEPSRKKSKSKRGRKIDPEFGAVTIESDEEVDRLSASESEDDGLEISYWRKNEDNTDKTFYKDFTEGVSAFDYPKNSWDSVFKYLKNSMQSNTNRTMDTIKRIREAEQRIAARREEQKLQRNVDDDEIKEDPDVSNNVEEERETLWADEDFSEEFLFDTRKDRVKVNEADMKRKEKKMERPDHRRKSKQDLQLEDEVAKCFEDAPDANQDLTFAAMNLTAPLNKAIDHIGYNDPTPIQTATIPLALQGRDICACAATGTGKTAAYMLPILERLLLAPRKELMTRVLILVPTRELGVQVFRVSNSLAKYTKLTFALSVGGLDLETQESELMKCPDIVIATPGRLIDHVLNCPGFDLINIEVLVLDEADRMVQRTFEEQVKEVIHKCAPNRQVMLFSATMTVRIKELAMLALRNPVKVFVNENTDVAQNLRQEFIRLKKPSERDATLVYLIMRSFPSSCLIFTDQRTEVHRLFVLLTILGVKVGEVHAKISQASRLLYLKRFSEGELDVLVATDVAARGLDIGGIKTIINHTMPVNYEIYVHRVGRTARANQSGRAISLVSQAQFHMLRRIKKSSKRSLFERIINKDLLAKYQEKVRKLKGNVEMVMHEEKNRYDEERLDKEVEQMERDINTAEQKLKAQDEKKEEVEEKPERQWFLSEKDMIIAKTRELVEVGKKRRIMQKRQKNNPNKNGKQTLGVKKDVQPRQEINKATKNIHKKDPNKYKMQINPFEDEDAPVKVKRKNMSSFAVELADVSSKSVKKFRAGPSYSERKEAFQEMNPDKKFNPRKKRK